MLVPGSARANVHLGRNIRQTTHFLEKHGFMTSMAASRIGSRQDPCYKRNLTMSPGITPFIWFAEAGRNRL
jgi:hypothetical protein